MSTLTEIEAALPGLAADTDLLLASDRAFQAYDRAGETNAYRPTR